MSARTIYQPSRRNYLVTLGAAFGALAVVTVSSGLNGPVAAGLVSL